MRVVDLSLPIRNGTLTPPSVGRKVEITTTFRRPGFWQASWFSIGAHTASHVDSPLHVIANAPTIGEIPIEKFFGEAVILDLTKCGQPNCPIKIEDLKPHEQDIKEDDIVVLRTDWSDKMFGLQEYFTQSPYLTDEAAEWLAEKKPKAVGFDFFQEYKARFTDFAPDDFTMHKTLLGKGIVLLEGFTNLGKLTKKRVKIFAVPIKVTEAEAAPARFFAIEE